MAPRMVKSLAVLRDQVNKLAPNRNKASDGWLGDAKHSMRKSDHNPEPDGTVDALDLTHDLKNGVDIQKLCDAIIASKDRRVSYLICNGKIISGAGGKQPWVKRNYSGPNKHTKHIHISVKDAHQDDTAPWKVEPAFGKAAAPSRPREAAPLAPAPAPAKPAPPRLTEKQKSAVMRRGSKGDFVAELQINLNALGYGPIAVDGRFGATTERAVKKLQTDQRLKADGWAGPRTLEAVGKALKDRELRPKLDEAEKNVPPAATTEVKKKTGLWTKITGGLGAAGAAVTAFTGMEWQVVVAIGVLAIVIIGLLFFMRHQIIAAFREINAEAAR